MLALENTGRGFFLLPPVVGSRLSIDAGCDADLPGAPPWLPPGSSPHPSWWAYSPPATCLRWVRRCGRGARSAPCSWPPRMPMAGAPTDLVVDAPPRTPCACSPLQPVWTGPAIPLGDRGGSRVALRSRRDSRLGSRLVRSCQLSRSKKKGPWHTGNLPGKYEVVLCLLGAAPGPIKTSVQCRSHNPHKPACHFALYLATLVC